MSSIAKINYVYKLAEKDSKFKDAYDKVSEDTIDFPYLAGKEHKGIVVAIYYGYLVGKNNKKLLEEIRNL